MVNSSQSDHNELALWFGFNIFNSFRSSTKDRFQKLTFTNIFKRGFCYLWVKVDAKHIFTGVESAERPVIIERSTVECVCKNREHAY